MLASVPEGSKSEVAEPTERTTSFVPDIAGTYVIQLFVNDGIRDREPGVIQIQAFTSRSEVLTAIQELEAEIVELDEEMFRNARMKNELIGKFHVVLANLESGRYTDSLNQLRNDIFPKLKVRKKSDTAKRIGWIEESESQRSIYRHVQDIIIAIEGLL